MQERLAGQIRRPDGTAVPGPATVWKGLNKPHRGDRRWALGWSPEQISQRLKVDFPDDEGMRISHEALRALQHRRTTSDVGDDAVIARYERDWRRHVRRTRLRRLEQWAVREIVSGRAPAAWILDGVPSHPCLMEAPLTPSRNPAGGIPRTQG